MTTALEEPNVAISDDVLTRSERPLISVVIPLYNEEESIPHLCSALTAALQRYGKPYEIIVVDDGSKDRSFELLAEQTQRDRHLIVIQLRRNFGQTAAFAAGFNNARGDVVITMDADLQNDPDDIPLLMEKIDEGYDIVSGWRKDRQDRFLDRRLPSMIANRLISNVTDVRLHDYGCSLKAYRRDVLQHVRLYGELHRFIPALASQVGGTVTEVPVNHRARQYGRSKYGISRAVRGAGPDYGLVSGRLFGRADPCVWHVGPDFGGGRLRDRPLSHLSQTGPGAEHRRGRCCNWLCCWW